MENEKNGLIRLLPTRLRERTRLVGHPQERPKGELVLYWLHHAMRAHENPALDVAVTLANRFQLPLLVYQAVPERYPYASDRHHTFILEGARDLEEQFDERGIHYALHVETRQNHGPHLRELCKRAAVLVTEELPVQPFRTWTDQLVRSATTPVLCVDTACIVPMQIVGGAYERAYQFRKETQSLYAERIAHQWEDAEPNLTASFAALPFEPIRLSNRDIADIVSACEVDHGIAPVPHTRGGSAAGYKRWEDFRSNGLDAYAKRRNDPLYDGTSRLSPYLHYGMISPLRVAREAADSNSQGAEKYLDELLIWRELAYTFCFYRRDHESLAALPDWARQTLAEHRLDPRPVIHSWETLARAQTGDSLWDAAQRSLLIHGELHNNVRMTWGKALLNWTPDGQTALALMIDLNHRYALDGRDPASYGGILWCLGQFDRPFKPARPILGTVRDRSTIEHVKRLDPDRYGEHTTRPLRQPRSRAAVIGAGLSGLICARSLLDHGVDVFVFEKSRGVGGRMATRRTTEGPRFDHGAQYFTVRDERFERYVKSWTQDGIVAPWHGRICSLVDGQPQLKENTTPRFVGVPGMSSIGRHLAADLNIQFSTQVSPPEQTKNTWNICDVSGRHLGEFDYVISTAPAPQSAELLARAPILQQQAMLAKMHACWAVMVSFHDSLQLPFDGAFVQDSPLSWISRNDSKPGRADDYESWVLHASPDWSNRFIDQEPDTILRNLMEAFWRATGAKPRATSYAAGHRWRYAIPSQPLMSRCLFHSEQRIGACGDWCSGPRIEGAFLSGMAMAGRILGHMLAAR